jgi:hypothetical protein
MSCRGLVAVVAIAFACGAAAGCGGSGSSDVPNAIGTTYPVETVEVQATEKLNCKGESAAKQRVQRAALELDLRELRAAAAAVKGHTENGNAALRAAIDKFALDIKKEALPVKKRSRFIDFAAAIVAPKCYLCFQALEANRPIAGGGKLACG